MPELPEVETTRRGIEPHVLNQTITQVVIRKHQLRWKIPSALPQYLENKTINKVERRGKYLLLTTTTGTVIIHLGMSGSLRVLPADSVATKHDHIDLLLTNQLCLRFNDPRRFGCYLWTDENPLQHSLLKNLGPEPLTTDFHPQYLYQQSRKRKTSIKLFIMDSKIVVGVGNIYANEALFQAGINPKHAAGKVTLEQYSKLVKAIKNILQAAIKQGGTTLRNFISSDGKLGYFKQKLKVYGRGGLDCSNCGTMLKEIRLGQRSTVFCGKCQK